MVWIREEYKRSRIENIGYAIVTKAKFDKKALACVAPINEQYRLKMQQQNGLWIFAKKEHGSERVAPSTSAT